MSKPKYQEETKLTFQNEFGLFTIYVHAKGCRVYLNHLRLNLETFKQIYDRPRV